MEFSHFSVMLPECMEGLRIRPDGVYVDATAGGAGHSLAIASRLGEKGQLLALDQDPDAVEIATKRLANYPQAKVIRTNFAQIRSVLDQEGVDGIDGILLDLGVSSHQLDTPQRGFSYHEDAPLDMRMSQEGLSAKDLVNTWPVEEICRVIRDYGEERYAWNIAKAIVRRREKGEIVTTGELAEIVTSAIPIKAARSEHKNPARRTFQGIRIAVNRELEVLQTALEEAFTVLRPGGRFVVLTFHSLEDRIVKQQFAAWAKGCTCPPDFPVCVCGNKPKGILVNKKPITASQEELEQNSRSRSAKLRIMEKI